MKAHIIDGFCINRIEKLPNGVRVLIASCSDHDEFKTLPSLVEYKGQTFGRTGWNSDRGIAYYRSDAMAALVSR